MQVREYLDGTVWARWLVDDIEPLPLWPPGRAIASENCACCNADNPAWTEAAPNQPRPRKVDLIYECDRCGHTTHQGRVAAAVVILRERGVR